MIQVQELSNWAKYCKTEPFEEPSSKRKDSELQVLAINHQNRNIFWGMREGVLVNSFLVTERKYLYLCVWINFMDLIDTNMLKAMKINYYNWKWY